MVTLVFFAGLTLLTLLPQGVAMAGYDNTATSNTQLSGLDELSGSEAQLYGLPTPPEMASNTGYASAQETANKGYGNEQGTASNGYGSEKASGSSMFAANQTQAHWYTVEKDAHWYPNGLGDM
jgi:hypothetical protein